MIRYDHYTDKFVKVSDRECPWCKAVCASTDKYCHECGWYIAKPQTDDERIIEMALNDCKAKHNGCENCDTDCAWKKGE